MVVRSVFSPVGRLGTRGRRPFGTCGAWRLPAVFVVSVLLAGSVSVGGAGAQSLPGAPSISQVTAGSGEVTVFWEAPADTAGVVVVAYDLRWIASDAPDKADANWTIEDSFWVSGVLSGVVGGLVNGTGYDFAMRASATADGPWSAAVSATPRDSAPEVTALVAGEQAFTVAWSAPVEVADADDVSYEVRWISSDASDKSDSRWSTKTGLGGCSRLFCEAGTQQRHRLRRAATRGHRPQQRMVGHLTCDPIRSTRQRARRHDTHRPGRTRGGWDDRLRWGPIQGGAGRADATGDAHHRRHPASRHGLQVVRRRRRIHRLQR